MSFQLNNSAECLGYLCFFVACNDGELHDEEAKRSIQAMAKMIKQLDIDVDGSGEVDNDDLAVAFNNVWEQMPDDFEEAAKHFVGICCNYFGKWSPENKSIVVSELAAVARADNVIQDVEKQNVNLVAELLDVEKPF
ncbi:MAG: TerB family tellurite resistance protein [Candidatus Marinimicrobia bacterium]|jgi:uncharacterized tellurite resistance protein B-like protein|nr:TerB family tellurite resistance protein [Candidatus Neomarinimicrobiota bacterium]|tara:strand:- start:359 stop:769 length:411 start_codon:yes stop_codon:yes gene_type:complete